MSSSVLTRVGEVAEQVYKEGIGMSGEAGLRRQGKASSLLANMIRTWQQTSTTEASKLIQPLAQEAENVARDSVAHAEYYQQRATGKIASDPRTARLASTIGNTVDAIYSKHAQAGYKVAPRVAGPYFPDAYPREVFEPGSALHKQAVDLIVQKRGKTIAQAEKILDTFNPNQFKNPLTGKFHHIESARTLHLPEIARKDIAVDLEYITKGIARFHEKQIFGENGEKAKVLLDMIRKESGIQGYNYARGIFSTMLGHNSDAYAGRVEREISSWEVASHLGLAVFSHPAKTIESAFVGGIKPFLNALNDLAFEHDEFKTFGMRSGAALNDTIHEIRRVAGAENEALGSKVLRATQFMKVINFQEMLHANVGRYAALGEFEDLLSNRGSKLARQRLETLGVDVDAALERKSLNEDDLLKAGYKMSKIVLGGRTVMDLPVLWKNNWAGRFLTMFKPFFFNQAKFIKDHVVKPALRGDPRALIYASIAYPLVGEAVADLKYFVRGRSQDERPSWDKFPYDRVVENISQVGGFGIASDVINAITTGTPTTTYQLLTGPAVSDIVDAVQLVRAGWDSKERAVLRRIPTIGPALSQLVAPPKVKHKGPLQRGMITKTIHKVEGFIE